MFISLNSFSTTYEYESFISRIFLKLYFTYTLKPISIGIKQFLRNFSGSIISPGLGFGILALRTLLALYIEGANMVTKAFTVDLNKPLVSQVGHLGDSYEKWVHQPIVSNETPRFFANDFLEFLTRTAWWAVPVIWLPVVWWYVSVSINDGLPPPQLVTCLVVGIFIWTLLEYSLHRFLFHITPKGYWGNTMHYLIHGCHHKHPMDGLRLVFPPAATAILLIPLWNLVKLVIPESIAPAMFGGGLLGYVMYDCTHYYLHHGKPCKGVSLDLKRFHMNHHFRVQDKGFGITSAFWDKMFGTLPPKFGGNKR